LSDAVGDGGGPEQQERPAESAGPDGPAGAATPGGGHRNRRRLVITSVAGLVVMAGVFFLLMPKASSYEEALGEIADLPVGWAVALVAAGLANIVLYPLTVLVAVPGLTYGQGFVERQSGFLVSNAIPGGGAVAVGTQYAILARYRVPPSRSAAAVSADALWTYLLTLGMPALAVVLLVIEGRSAAGIITVAAIGIAAVAVSVVLTVVVLRSEAGARRVGGWGERVVRPIMHRFNRPTPDLVGALVAFRTSAHDLVARKWVALTITNTVAQTTPFVVLVCAIGGLGELWDPLTLAEIFAAYTVALLLVSFPITPGGLGTVDAALVALLVAFGGSGSVAVAADLIWRVVWFLPQLLVGLVAFGTNLIGRRRVAAA
jgi:putative heme transporter